MQQPIEAPTPKALADLVALWKNGECGVSTAAMLDYLARLTGLAQERAPDVAGALLARSEAIAATHDLLAAGPRQRGG